MTPSSLAEFTNEPAEYISTIEDGGSMFFRNIGKFYQTTRRHVPEYNSSCLSSWNS
jgi:hypothetical protein